MGLRFYRRVHLCPGLSVNLSRSGPSLSVGVRGAHVTVGRTGITKTVGLPGTGLFYTSRRGYHTGYHSVASDAGPRPPDVQAAADRHVERRIALIVVVLLAGAALLLLR